jgi:hypothetical protein
MPRRASTPGESIEGLCDAMERYFDTLRDAGFELSAHVLAPQPEKDIAALERKLELELPADLRAFLRRGLRGARGSIEDGDELASFGFDFLGCKTIVKTTQMLREVGEELDDDDEHGQLVARGVALTFEEPQLLWAGELVHFSFRNPPLRVGKSFSGFLRDYLASGCFRSHSFALAWKRVAEYVPLRVAPSKNAWVKAYEKQFA